MQTFAERYAKLSKDQKAQLFLALHAKSGSKNLASMSYRKPAYEEAEKLVERKDRVDYWCGVAFKMNMDAPDPWLYDRDAKAPALTTLNKLFGDA